MPGSHYASFSMSAGPANESTPVDSPHSVFRHRIMETRETHLKVHWSDCRSDTRRRIRRWLTTELKSGVMGAKEAVSVISAVSDQCGRTPRSGTALFACPSHPAVAQWMSGRFLSDRYGGSSPLRRSWQSLVTQWAPCSWGRYVPRLGRPCSPSCTHSATRRPSRLSGEGIHGDIAVFCRGSCPPGPDRSLSDGGHRLFCRAFLQTQGTVRCWLVLARWRRASSWP